MKDRQKYWLWMSHACGQGSKSAVNILRRFGYPEDVFSASSEKIKKELPSTDSRILARLSRKDTMEEEDILSWCEKNGVTVLTPDSDSYPKSLLGLKDAPLVLYALGEVPDLSDYFSCAVVGTRTMTDYGRKTAYNIGTGLADGGACLVSGLALGIDGMAMAGALEAGGRCVAVLGCGIDVVYPKEHEGLLKKVMENGAVITEYAPGVSPVGSHFPVRNRIISGLSRAVCVVEGNMRSGSLITARHALYQGRSLYAVPGPVGETSSEGSNYLLKQGAKIVTCAEDILEDYQFIYPHTLRTNASVPHISPEEAAEDYGISAKGALKKKKPFAKREKKEAPFKTEEKIEKKSAPLPDLSSLGEDDRTVLDYMTPDVPMIADEIARCGLPLSRVMVALTMLELAGAVEAGAGGYYLKRAADLGDAEYITEEDNGI